MNTIASTLCNNVLGCLSLDIICFLKAHSFPQATLSDNCLLLGADNVRAQIFEHIFMPIGGYCLYINTANYMAAPEEGIKVNSSIHQPPLEVLCSSIAKHSKVLCFTGI